MDNKRSRDDFERDNSQPYQDDKRQRKDPADELVANVCGDIQALDPRNIEDVAYISNPIVVEFEKIDKLRVSFLNTIYAMIIEQPSKINVIGDLVLICNAKNFVVGKYVVEFIHAKAQTLLNKLNPDFIVPKNNNLLDEFSGIFNNIKSILKFLAVLVPIIENYAIINVFEQFLKLAIDLNEVSNGTAQQIFYNCLISIPYLLCNDDSPELLEKVNQLVDLASTFKTNQGSSDDILLPFIDKANVKKTIENKRLVDLILPAIQSLQGEDKLWKGLNNTLFAGRKQLLTPIISEALANNSLSKDMVKYPLPQLAIVDMTLLSKYSPTGLIDELWSKNSRVIFQIYNSTTDFETVPKIETYQGLFFQDLISDIITNLSFNKQEAGTLVYNLDLAFSQDLAPVNTSIDQLTLIHQDNLSGENSPPLSTWKTEDLAVENIINMMFQLPRSLHREIYYFSVLTVICQQSPANIAPVFGRAIRYLYNNLETLDYELRARFADWMSIQLSNFEFSWKWDEWVEDSQKYSAIAYHPKKNFVTNLIAKEIRLSNKKRIKESFIALDPETSDIVPLDEYFQYLDVSLYDNKDFLINYDYELYGNVDTTKEILDKLYEEKKTTLESKHVVSAQDEMIFNFSSPELPLHELSTAAYELIVANWKPNDEFDEFYKKLLLEIEEKHQDINGPRFLINLIFQTYVYVGSRSIYSVVSLLSRDINKLKYLSGQNITYEDEEPQFAELELTPEDIKQRQQWIIESIIRIWFHQPQIIFLVLEYLVEYEIVQVSYVIEAYLNIDHNLVIGNLSCSDSLIRLLSHLENKPLVLQVLQLATNNLNAITQKLNVANTDPVEIDTVFPHEPEAEANVNSQWLFYEYKGLIKSFYRRFIRNQPIDYQQEVEDILKTIENTPTNEEVVSWLA